MSIECGIPHTLSLPYSFGLQQCISAKPKRIKQEKIAWKGEIAFLEGLLCIQCVMTGNSENGVVICIYYFLKPPNSVISYTISLSFRLLDFSTTAGSMVFNWFFIVCQLEYYCTPQLHLCLHVEFIIENPENFEFWSSQPKKRTLKCYHQYLRQFNFCGPIAVGLRLHTMAYYSQWR